MVTELSKNREPEKDPTTGRYYYRTRWSSYPLVDFKDGTTGVQFTPNIIVSFFHSEVARDTGIEMAVGTIRRVVQTIAQ